MPYSSLPRYMPCGVEEVFMQVRSLASYGNSRPSMANHVQVGAKWGWHAETLHLLLGP